MLCWFALRRYYLYLAELPDAWDLPDKIKARLAGDHSWMAGGSYS